MPFAFLNYTYEHGAGLIRRSQIVFEGMGVFEAFNFHVLEAIMILFPVLHFVLLVLYGIRMVAWWNTEERKDLQRNPIKNTSLLVPIIAVVMSMNVLIGPVRYFIPSIAQNLQEFMLPALLAWGILWIVGIVAVTAVLKHAFHASFDIGSVGFNWSLVPFLLFMISVTGSGIAALAQSEQIAHVAAFMSLVTMTAGVFVFGIYAVVMFLAQFSAKSMPEKQAYPSFLSLVPGTTLLGITIYRLLHYVEHQHHIETGALPMIVVTALFAFEVWYLFFGVMLLRDYVRNDLLKGFHVSQWGLICPFVAFPILGSFVYGIFVPSAFLYFGIGIAMIFVVGLYGFLFVQQYRSRV